MSEKANLFAIFSEPPPNFGVSKVKQTSAECRQAYLKLVQGVLARDNDTLSDKNRKPPRIAPDGFR